MAGGRRSSIGSKALARLGWLALEDCASLASLLPGPSPLTARTVAAWIAWDGPACPRCGAFLAAGVPGPGVSPDPASGGCASCPSPLPFRAARSLFVYEGAVSEGIRLAKYRGVTGAARPLAARLAQALGERWNDLVPPGARPSVVPVPLRPSKFLLRGYNFPGLLGSALARLAGWPFAPALLRRTRGGPPQAGLPLGARAANVRGAFRSAPRGRIPPAVLIIDDVYTSGATAAECAAALKRGGAEDIVVVTAARAVP